MNRENQECFQGRVRRDNKRKILRGRRESIEDKMGSDEVETAKSKIT